MIEPLPYAFSIAPIARSMAASLPLRSSSTLCAALAASALDMAGAGAAPTRDLSSMRGLSSMLVAGRLVVLAGVGIWVDPEFAPGAWTGLDARAGVAALVGVLFLPLLVAATICIPFSDRLGARWSSRVPKTRVFCACSPGSGPGVPFTPKFCETRL